MTKCPVCGAEGADILLNKVFCPNVSCQWYDKETAYRVRDEMLKNFVAGFPSTNSRVDPDVTPVWQAWYIPDDGD